jgi:hypothetical protein
MYCFVNSISGCINVNNAIRITERGGPYGCETQRIPHFLDNRMTEGGEVINPMSWPRFSLRRFLVLIPVIGRVDPQVHSAAGRVT